MFASRTPDAQGKKPVEGAGFGAEKSLAAVPVGTRFAMTFLRHGAFSCAETAAHTWPCCDAHGAMPTCNPLSQGKGANSTVMERYEIARRDIRPMTVCIIDDDAATRESLRVVLADVGYDIVEAADGVEGRALLEANQMPMVVLLDNQMPLLDGGAILNLALHHEALRERYAYIVMSASPVRATSAWLDAITALQVPVLAKPFDIGALLQAIRDAERRLEHAV